MHYFQVLKELSLKISRGEKLALVGPSGSGKSSLIKVIQRLYDVQFGEVSVLYIWKGLTMPLPFHSLGIFSSL